MSTRRVKKPKWYYWSVDEVAEELIKYELPNVGKIFKDNEICGRVLGAVTEERLDEMGVSPVGKKLLTLQFLENLKERVSVSPTKIFNDPIHGHIELHPLCVAIIDTPQFQRLRNIKQMGGAYFLCPGASHNRFEHSIGVCHLAGELGKVLQEKQPELNISNEDILCVQIAGLCHDLGHGPFSHLFDRQFIPAVCPGTKWQHEDASVKMLQHLLDENNLKDVFTKNRLLDRDIIFIKELIAGPLSNKKTTTFDAFQWHLKVGRTNQDEDYLWINNFLIYWVTTFRCSSYIIIKVKRFDFDNDDWPYEGRGRDKSFLYEIVANKRNCIDVDKFDYFARDCHGVGIQKCFDHSRLVQFAKVLCVEGEMQICFRDKEAGNVYDMFYTRKSIHKHACRHPVTINVEAMITDLLIKANDHLKIQGKDGNSVKMSDSIHDMVALAKMNDSVLDIIAHSKDPNLKESQELLNRIYKRDLYIFLRESQPETHIEVKKVSDIIEEVYQIARSTGADEVSVNKEDILISLMTLDYGKKLENPVDGVRFYSKDNPEEAFKLGKEEVSKMLPNIFQEQVLRLYSKNSNAASNDRLTSAFVQWCKENNINISMKDFYSKL